MPGSDCSRLLTKGVSRLTICFRVITLVLAPTWPVVAAVRVAVTMIFSWTGASGKTDPEPFVRHWLLRTMLPNPDKEIFKVYWSAGQALEVEMPPFTGHRMGNLGSVRAEQAHGRARAPSPLRGPITVP